jgi:mRNA interferase HigB
VHVISFRKLQEASRKHGIGKQPDAWYRIAKSAKWTNLEETRRTYATADGVVVNKKTYTVFNIHGNEFRLIVGIHYPSQTMFIKHVLTHAEYSKGDWKK